MDLPPRVVLVDRRGGRACWRTTRLKMACSDSPHLHEGTRAGKALHCFRHVYLFSPPVWPAAGAKRSAAAAAAWRDEGNRTGGSRLTREPPPPQSPVLLSRPLARNLRILEAKAQLLMFP